MPWEIVCGLSMIQFAKGRFELGMAILIGTIFYLRPSELLNLKVRHIVAPLPEAGAGHRQWSLVLHEGEDELSKPSKTGVFDECLLLDLGKYSFLGDGLARLTSKRAGEERLIPCTARELAASLQEGGRLLGMSPPPMPYQLRHSGPSIDFSDGSRTLAGIKRRGRWRTDSSLRRYEKGAQLTRTLRRLSVAARDFVVRSSRVLPEVVAGRARASLP
jgi:hypothetical protein